MIKGGLCEKSSAPTGETGCVPLDVWRRNGLEEVKIWDAETCLHVLVSSFFLYVLGLLGVKKEWT